MVKKDALNLCLVGPTRNKEAEREKGGGTGKAMIEVERLLNIKDSGVGEVADLPESCSIL